MKHIIITAFATIALCFSLLVGAATAANYWYPVGIPIPSTAPPAGQVTTLYMGMGNYSAHMSTPDFTQTANWGDIKCKVKDGTVSVHAAFRASDFPLSPPSEISCWQSYLGDNWGLKMWPVTVDVDYTLFSGTPFSSTADDIDSPPSRLTYMFELPSGSTWTESLAVCKRGVLFTTNWTGVSKDVIKVGSKYWAIIHIAPNAAEASGRCSFPRSGGSTQHHKIDLNWL